MTQTSGLSIFRIEIHPIDIANPINLSHYRSNTMKKILTLLLLILTTAVMYSQVHLGAKFVPKSTVLKPDTAYFGDIGLRGAWVAPDLDKDGKPEIIVTDYTRTGRVHVFQSAGNDTIEWIWSSPRLDLIAGQPYGAGAGSTPRTIRSGDLDGDGKGEIIFGRPGTTGGGFMIFEWDGVTGSHKFGTIPSAVVPQTVPYGSSFGAKAGLPVEGGLQTAVEHFEVDDVDGDGKQELLVPKNLTLTPNDDFLIISASGEWDFENQGFASFQIEGASNLIASTSFGGGAPYAIHPADLDGDGKKEIVCHNWNFADYWVIKATGADTYVIPDTTNSTNGNQYYYMTPAFDHVALFGGIVADLDKDKNDEVYFPLYGGGSANDGALFVVDYKPGDDVLKADSTHAIKVWTGVSQTVAGAPFSSFTGVVADLDRNGKQEILVGSSYPSNVVAIEYKGTGSIRDSNNYIRKVYYAGESDNYGTIVYSDSLGVKKDTAKTAGSGEGFVSKMTKPADLDGDGKQEIVLPYQAIIDSVTYTWRHWNTDSAKFLTDSTKKLSNPKKWGFRILESDVVGSVGNRDYTVITPDDYQLLQNYPNPFNPTTTISFVLPLAKKVTLRVYDMLGKEVVTLVNNQEYTKGTHNLSWNGKDKNGKTVASGAYIAKMSAGNVEKNVKMMMLK